MVVEAAERERDAAGPPEASRRLVAAVVAGSLVDAHLAKARGLVIEWIHGCVASWLWLLSG